MKQIIKSSTVIQGSTLYHLKPYEGPKLVLQMGENLFVTGRDCEVKGVIIREEPAPTSS